MKFIGKLFLKAERKKLARPLCTSVEVTDVTQSPWKLIVSVGQHLDFEN